MARIRSRYGSALGTFNVSMLAVRASSLTPGAHTQYDQFETEKYPRERQRAQLDIGSISIMGVSGGVSSSGQIHKTKRKISK
jgi:hypothetical protein